MVLGGGCPWGGVMGVNSPPMLSDYNVNELLLWETPYQYYMSILRVSCCHGRLLTNIISLTDRDTFIGELIGVFTFAPLSSILSQ